MSATMDEQQLANLRCVGAPGAGALFGACCRATPVVTAACANMVPCPPGSRVGRRAVRHQLQQVGLQGELHKLLLEHSRVGQAITVDEALDVLQVRGVGPALRCWPALSPLAGSVEVACRHENLKKRCGATCLVVRDTAG